MLSCGSKSPRARARTQRRWQAQICRMPSANIRSWMRRSAGRGVGQRRIGALEGRLQCVGPVRTRPLLRRGASCGQRRSRVGGTRATPRSRPPTHTHTPPRPQSPARARQRITALPFQAAPRHAQAVPRREAAPRLHDQGRLPPSAAGVRCGTRVGGGCRRGGRGACGQ